MPAYADPKSAQPLPHPSTASPHQRCLLVLQSLVLWQLLLDIQAVNACALHYDKQVSHAVQPR